MPSQRLDPPNGSWTFGRIASALAIGFSGAGLIWVFSPYINDVISATNVTDSYLPPAVFFFLLLLVLVVNPLLRRFTRRVALNGRQLAIVTAIFFMACATPGMGLMRFLPHTLAQASLNVSNDRTLAKGYAAVHFSPWLFPDKVEYGAKTPVADYFIRDLPPGQTIPWGAWGRPLVAWGTMLLACWVMTIGLGMIVYPQWRRNERLAFPLLEVYQSVIEDPGEGHLFPPIFRSRLFWGAVIAVFWLEIQEVAKLYLPGTIPVIPLRWDLSSLFTEEPLVYLPAFVKTGKIIFVLIGVSYFMPTRISFSIWVFVLIYALYQMAATAYMPPFEPNIVTEHRVGALAGSSIGVMWLGRSHWARVMKCVFRRAKTDEDRRERQAGIMFLAGCAGMLIWLTGVGGVPIGWAIPLVLFAFMVSLIIARIVSETGMPYLRLDYRYQMSWVKLAPFSWISPAVIYFAMVISILFPLASVVNPTAIAAQTSGFDSESKPRQHMWMAWVLLATLVGGLLVSGASHLWCNYHHASTLDGTTQPISQWGTTRMASADADLRAYTNGTLNKPMYSLGFHIGFGAVVAGVLQYLSFTIPKWPLHPVGLLITYSWFSTVAWQSLFIGWLIKLMILRYGGARLYRSARPAFLGIIVGTCLGEIGRTVLPVVLVILGKPYYTFV